MLLEVIILNNNKIDMAQMMSMLSKMDKKDLEEGLNKVSKMLNSKEADQVINQIKKNTNQS